MSSADDLLTAYNSLSEGEQEQFWAKLYASGHKGVSPLPPPPNDVQKALEGLLIGVSVLGPKGERDLAKGFSSIFKGAPESVAAIESTATAMSKWWATATAVGGPLAWIVAWNAALADYWVSATPGEKIAVIAAGAVTLVAVVLSIAILVSSDVKARSMASVGQYQARALITQAYLQSGTREPGLSTHQPPGR